MSATVDLLADFASPAPAPVRVGWMTNNKPCWAFDIPALERACALLGVTRPVVVGPVNARRRWIGMHHDEGDHHRVTCAWWASPEEASRTLWHELSHAAQSDRGIRGGTTRLRGAAYEQDPRECEARDAEDNHTRVGSLVTLAWSDGEPA